MSPTKFQDLALYGVVTFFEKLNFLSFPGYFKFFPQQLKRAKFKTIHFQWQLCHILIISLSFPRFYNKIQISLSFPRDFDNFSNFLSFPGFHVFQVCGQPARLTKQMYNSSSYQNFQMNNLMKHFKFP